MTLVVVERVIFFCNRLYKHNHFINKICFNLDIIAVFAYTFNFILSFIIRTIRFYSTPYITFTLHKRVVLVGRLYSSPIIRVTFIYLTIRTRNNQFIPCIFPCVPLMRRWYDWFVRSHTPSLSIDVIGDVFVMPGVMAAMRVCHVNASNNKFIWLHRRHRDRHDQTSEMKRARRVNKKTTCLKLSHLFRGFVR